MSAGRLKINEYVKLILIEELGFCKVYCNTKSMITFLIGY
jgi:hypothetical protein